MTDHVEKWLAVRLYYAEPWEEFLLYAVKPYTEVLLDTGIATSFYFRRKWERGPHIELWIKGNEVVLDQIVRQNLKEYFQQYFENRPSFRTKIETFHKISSRIKWLPNNSVQFFDTEVIDKFPVTHPLGDEVFREQLFANARLVLQIIKNKKGKWTYDTSLAAAMKLSLGFLHSMGLTKKKLKVFFNWVYHENSKLPILNNDHHIATNERNYHDSFATAFHLQQEEIVIFYHGFWAALEANQPMRYDVFKKWLKTNAETRYRLHLLQDAQKLQHISTIYSKKSSPRSHLHELYLIYLELICDLNNVLGVHGKDQHYLWYVLYQSSQNASVDIPYISIDHTIDLLI